MEQSELELQLEVWKELAVSKQVLMHSATDALGLNEECSSEELETALKRNIGGVEAAELESKKVQAEAREEVSVLAVKLAEMEKSIKNLTIEKEEALKAHAAAEHKFESGQTANSEESKKIKAQLVDKQKEIKQITKILADTPENVAKKMKRLQKEKMDEANTRKKAEEISRNLRKDKQKIEQDLKESKTINEKSIELAGLYRDLQKLANEQYTQLADKVDEKSSLEVIPALNEELLELIEGPSSEDKEKK